MKEKNNMKRIAALVALAMMLGVNFAYAEPTITDIDDAGDVVHITVVDSDGFYAGAMPYLLKLGEHTFRKSRHPESGDLNVLIFSVDKPIFNTISDSDLVSLGYGEVKHELPEQASDNARIQSARKSSASAEKKSRLHWTMNSLGHFKNKTKNKTK